MPIDIYADELVPERTSQTSRSGPAGWVGGLILLAALIGVGCVFFLQSCSGPAPAPDGDHVDPPAVNGLYVLVLEETADRFNLPPSQVAIFTSAPLREWYEQNCAKVNGEPAYRCFDKDDKLDREAAIWREMREKVTIDPPAYLVVSGKYAEQGKLPKDPPTWQSTLEKVKAKGN